VEYELRQTPVRKSLIETRTLGGVEFRLAMLNGTISAAIVMALQNWYYIPVAILIQLFLAWVTKKDPLVVKIYARYNLLGDVYDPWPRHTMRMNSRPEGFGKGLIC
jgi:type IV secretory pathway TrbD component